MPREVGWIGSFRHPEGAAAAIGALRAAGVKEIRAAMPAPFHEVDAALHRRPSRLGWITFVGGLTGALAGFWFTSWTSLDWPLNIAGKPFVSLVPYSVIAFECFVLFGALTNLGALAVLVVLGRRRAMPHRPEFSRDRIGVIAWEAGCPDPKRCSEILLGAGAEEVERVEV